MSSQCGQNGYCELHPVPKYEIISPAAAASLYVQSDGNFSSSRIRRPPNAFMIFAQEHRRLLAHQNPQESNKKISTILGNMWRELNKVQKEHYYQKAKMAEVEHKQKYPDYVYNPQEARKRKEMKAQIRLLNRNGAMPSEKLDGDDGTGETSCLNNSQRENGVKVPMTNATSSTTEASCQPKPLDATSMESNGFDQSALQGLFTSEEELSSMLIDQTTEGKPRVDQERMIPSGEAHSNMVPGSFKQYNNYLPNVMSSPVNEGYFGSPYLMSSGYMPPYMMGLRPRIPYPHPRYYGMMNNPWEVDRMRSYPFYSPQRFLRPRHPYLSAQCSAAGLVPPQYSTVGLVPPQYSTAGFIPPQYSTAGLAQYNGSRRMSLPAENITDAHREEEMKQGNKTSTAAPNDEVKTEDQAPPTEEFNPQGFMQKQHSPSSHPGFSQLPIPQTAPPWGLNNFLKEEMPLYNYSFDPSSMNIHNRMYPSPMKTPLVDPSAFSAVPYFDYNQIRPWHSPYQKLKPSNFSHYRYQPYEYQLAQPEPHIPLPKEYYINRENFLNEMPYAVNLQPYLQNSFIPTKPQDDARAKGMHFTLEEYTMPGDGSGNRQEDSFCEPIVVVDDDNEQCRNVVHVKQDEDGKLNVDTCEAGLDNSFARTAGVLNYEQYTNANMDEFKPLDLSNMNERLKIVK